jgi:hypothetical protein
MSRGMISALAAAITVVWIAGFLSLVVTNEQRSADVMAEYMYGRCLQSGSGSSNALRCMAERDAYAKTAFSRIAWPKVLPIAAVPLLVIWLGAWGVARRRPQRERGTAQAGELKIVGVLLFLQGVLYSLAFLNFVAPLMRIPANAKSPAVWLLTGTFLSLGLLTIGIGSAMTRRWRRVRSAAIVVCVLGIAAELLAVLARFDDLTHHTLKPSKLVFYAGSPIYLLGYLAGLICLWRWRRPETALSAGMSSQESGVHKPQGESAGSWCGRSEQPPAQPHNGVVGKGFETCGTPVGPSSDRQNHFGEAHVKSATEQESRDDLPPELIFSGVERIAHVIGAEADEIDRPFADRDDFLYTGVLVGTEKMSIYRLAAHPETSIAIALEAPSYQRINPAMALQLLRELPDVRLVRRLRIVDGRHPEEPWIWQTTGRRHIVQAEAYPDGEIKLY